MINALKNKTKVILRNFLTQSLLFRYLGKLIVVNNQRKILEHTKSNKVIFLNPVSPTLGKGKLDNYFHFIFDLLFPLNKLINDSPNDVVFAFKDIGLYTDRLKSLFCKRIIIIENKENFDDVKQSSLIGMNPKWVHITDETALNFKNDVFNKLGIRESVDIPKKIILVERIPLDTEIKSRAISKVGGSSRRSILNHDELSIALKSMIKPPYEFLNLQMENLSFSQQALFFDSAVIMIAQHGAALANALWMKTGSILIELSSYKSRDHGSSICRINEKKYYLYQTDSEHPKIDIDHFKKWILNNANLEKYFYNK